MALIVKTLLMLLLLCCCFSDAQAAQPPLYLEAEGQVAGVSLEDWSARWWQWANAFPGRTHPYHDPDGSLCGQMQQGPVWFLAGTDGGVAQRLCSVPTGKYLFFPVINMINYARYKKGGDCEAMRTSAAVNNDHLAYAWVAVDDVEIPDIVSHRVQTHTCFDPFLRSEDADDIGAYAPGASDGYWIMLKPLAPGVHKIIVRARYHNPDEAFGDMEQVFQYRIDVRDDAPEAAPLKKEQESNPIIFQMPEHDGTRRVARSGSTAN